MEYRKKCNVCGKVYCFTDEDLNKNASNSKMAALSALGEFASILGGTRLDTYALDNQSDRYSSKVVDYARCPSCNSTNTSFITDEEWTALQQSATTPVQNTPSLKIDINSNATTDSLLKRTKMFLEEEEWEHASAYCEQILDIEPECAMAYVYKLMFDLKVTEQDKLALLDKPFTDEKNYKKAIRFADDSLKSFLEGYINTINERNNEKAYLSAMNAYNSAKTDAAFKALVPKFKALGDYKNSAQLVQACEEKAILAKYNHALMLQRRAKTEKEFLEAKAEFESLNDYSDARDQAVVCMEKSEDAKKDSIYNDAVSAANSDSIASVEGAVKEFEKIPGWRDADQKKTEALEKIVQLRKAAKRAGRKTTIIAISVVVAILVIIGIGAISTRVKNNNKYNLANEKYTSGDYISAIQIWSELHGYKDSPDRIKTALSDVCDDVMVLIDEGDYEQATKTLDRLMIYINASNRAPYDQCRGRLTVKESIDQIESGDPVNLTEIYQKINALPPEYDTSEFYELDLIKQVEYLGTTWKLQKAICNGNRNEPYENTHYGYSFENGCFVQLDEKGNPKYNRDLYYTNGIFSAGPETSGDSYQIITNYDGVGDTSIVVIHEFDATDNRTHYVWEETLTRD